MKTLFVSGVQGNEE